MKPFGVFGALGRLFFGQQISAVIGLTWKAALRFRLFVVVAVLLLGSVVVLPVLIKDDGTARGFTQILLTYTLSAITALLGISTLWLACGTLARDIEDCQLQVVAVKPITRWRIWLGKWLGIMTLNAVLLGISGFGVYALLQWRATKLPDKEQETLRNEILVARGSVRPESPETELKERVAQRLQERLKQASLSAADVDEVRRQIREQIKAEYEQVPPGYTRTWQLKLGSAKDKLRDRPMQMRVKFMSADRSPSGTFGAMWQFGVPRKTALAQSQPMSLAPETFHEFAIPPNLFDEDGVLTVSFLNVNNTIMIFPIDEGIELLYPKGSFGPNFARGLGVIFCWMGLLAAIGLFAASFLSFPVAAFFAVGVLTIVFSTKTIESAVSEGTLGHFNEENGTNQPTILDPVVIPILEKVLWVLKLARGFSPVESLSTGRDVGWGELARAFAAIVLFLGGPFALSGMGILTRRELATAQGTQ
jgi:ABC-type transport system involved in multi-copper enzyme maturation permease subunit